MDPFPQVECHQVPCLRLVAEYLEDLCQWGAVGCPWEDPRQHLGWEDHRVWAAPHQAFLVLWVLAGACLWAPLPWVLGGACHHLVPHLLEEASRVWGGK